MSKKVDAQALFENIEFTYDNTRLMYSPRVEIALTYLHGETVESASPKLRAVGASE